MKKQLYTYCSRPSSSNPFFRSKRNKFQKDASSPLNISLNSFLLTTTTSLLPENNVTNFQLKTPKSAKKFRAIYLGSSNNKEHGYSFYRATEENGKTPYLGQYNIFSMITRSSSPVTKKTSSSFLGYKKCITQVGSPPKKTKEKLVFINKKKIVLSNSFKQNPKIQNLREKIKIIKNTNTPLKVSTKRKVPEIIEKKDTSNKKIPFQVKQIEVFKNPDSNLFYLYNFAKEIDKKQKEYYDGTIKDKMKHLSKEINHKESKIKKELQELKRTRIINDAYLKRRFLTSEKTFFDIKIKME